VADLEQMLQPTFAARHVKAALKYFQAMTTEFQQAAWEEAISKGGKFIEATLKALYVHVGKVLPPAREFKAGKVMNELEQLASGSFDDAIRLTIPRACKFAFDIASNRGARHDPGEIDPNEMDARAVVAAAAWTLAEMLRYAQKGALDPAATRELVDGLTQRQYPLIEDIDGRVYFHVRGASARDVALLSLWHKHPGRMTEDELIAAVMRHHFKKPNATIAVSRLGHLVDHDEHGRLRLLQPGMRMAESLISSAEIRD
jgi:predicted nucleic acid-binding protein